MPRYFVKAIFSGWREVSKANYLSFIRNIMDNATAMTKSEKIEHIRNVTKKIFEKNSQTH